LDATSHPGHDFIQKLRLYREHQNIRLVGSLGIIGSGWDIVF
jgi:hypothetical protein